jgi:kynurenine formamidase
MDETAVLGLFDSCSNWGRWGESDERGTLNYITPAKRRAAARLVQTGQVVSLGRDLSTQVSPANPRPVVHRMLYVRHHDPFSAHDSLDIAVHGYRVTHLDALGHVYFDGSLYNNRQAADAVSAHGLRFASIQALREGIFTRGVLLDVAAARGSEYLASGEGVSPGDLDAAEERAGVRVETGDAVFVRVGLGAREAVEGEEDPKRRAGLLPDCIPWLHEREVAVYSGDCIEQIPSPYQTVPMPLHMVGLAAMGLVMLDNTDAEALADACRLHKRAEFLVTCAPLRIPGGTGSAVNPLAVF